MSLASVCPIVLLGVFMIQASLYAQNPDDLSAFGIPPGALPVANLAGETDTRRVYWNNRAISITLQVGVERQVRFPAGIRLGIPGKLENQLRSQSVDGTVHWLAYEPFETTRVQVRELQSGRTYLLDLSAVAEGGGVMPLEILDGTHAADYYSSSPDVPSAVSPEDELMGPATASSEEPVTPLATGTYDYVSLTRFAIQQLYAPERLLARLSLPGVSRVPVRQTALPLYRGGALRAEPYVAWTDGRYYITAVKLSNLTAQSVLIDPRHLRGQWLARTLLNARVLPYGDALGRDQSIVFLLSPVPFAEASR